MTTRGDQYKECEMVEVIRSAVAREARFFGEYMLKNEYIAHSVKKVKLKISQHQFRYHICFAMYLMGRKCVSACR